MLARPVSQVNFEVTAPYGRVIYWGTSTDDLGSWNSASLLAFAFGAADLG